MTKKLVNDGSTGHKRYEEVKTTKEGRDIKLVALDATSPYHDSPQVDMFGLLSDGGGGGGGVIHLRDLGVVVGVPALLQFKVRAAEAFGYKVR